MVCSCQCANDHHFFQFIKRHTHTPNTQQTTHSRQHKNTHTHTHTHTHTFSHARIDEMKTILISTELNNNIHSHRAKINGAKLNRPTKDDMIIVCWWGSSPRYVFIDMHKNAALDKKKMFPILFPFICLFVVYCCWVLLPFDCDLLLGNWLVDTWLCDGEWWLWCVECACYLTGSLNCLWKMSFEWASE